MGAVVAFSQTLEASTCATCGVCFAMPDHLFNSKRNEGGKFYCPNGHELCFAKSDNQRLREQVQAKERELASSNERLRAALSREEFVSRSRDAYKGKLNHMKAHVGNGVCPCCRRNFTNLRRHMQTKHPEWKKKEEP